MPLNSLVGRGALRQLQARLSAETRLWLLGLASVALYLFAFTARLPIWRYYAALTDIGKMTGYSLSSGMIFLGAELALFALYLLGLGQARRLSWQRARRPVLVTAALSGIALVLLYPITATDIYSYILQARVWVAHGANPLVVPPTAFPSDPLLVYAGAWGGYASPYGPLWCLVSLPAGWLAGHSLLAGLLTLKALALLAYLGSGLLLAGWLGREDAGWQSAGTLLVLWNPLLLLEAVGNGHNDILMVLALLLALRLARGRLALLAPLALCLGALIKYPAALLLPLPLIALWRQRERRAALGALLLLTAALALAFAPFWRGGETFAVILHHSGVFSGSPGGLLYAVGELLLPGAGAALARGIVLTTFALYYAWVLLAAWKQPEQWPRLGFGVFFFLMFALAQFRAWYLIWPLALAPAARPGQRAAAVAFTLGSMLGTFVYAYTGAWLAWGPGERYLLVVPLTFLPPLLVLLAWPEPGQALLFHSRSSPDMPGANGSDRA